MHDFVIFQIEQVSLNCLFDRFSDLEGNFFFDPVFNQTVQVSLFNKDYYWFFRCLQVVNLNIIFDLQCDLAVLCFVNF